MARSGHYGRHLSSDRFPGVAVLCYHGVRARSTAVSDIPFGPLHVSEDELREHCSVIVKHAHPIGLELWLDALEGQTSLPDRAVLVTFDDGYRSGSTLGKPILEKFDVPAVVFVSTEAVRARTFFWHDAVALAEGEQTVEAWKSLAFDEWNGRRRECQDKTASLFSTDHPLAPLSPEELNELANDRVELGGHTESHVILSRATRDQQRSEIGDNKRWLDETCGRPIRAFAYPNGRPGTDYNTDSVELVEQAGYRIDFTTQAGFALPSERALERSRFMMLAGIGPEELLHRLSYSWRK